MYPIRENDWTLYRKSILDPGLNVAIKVMSNRLFPAGFDVSESAPDTYEKLVALFESGQRYVVYSGGSEQTIYGDPWINYHFRAWHDWCHWKGAFDFTLNGEFGAYKLQCRHLVCLYGENETTSRWKRIMFADIIGQRLFFNRHGVFPEDQMTFVRSYLETGFCGKRRTAETEFPDACDAMAR